MSDEIKETAAATQAAAEAEAPAAEAAPVDNKRKKTGRYIPNGIAFIHATFNNTKVAFTDLHGNVIAWSSSGKNGFKGSRKSTAYAAGFRHEGRRSPHQRTGRRPRIRRPRHRLHRHGSQLHQGHHPGSPQRLPSPEAPPQLTVPPLFCPGRISGRPV